MSSNLTRAFACTLVLLSALMPAACWTSKKTGDSPRLSPDAPKNLKQSIRPITKVGENGFGRYSPDGSRILFVSRVRPHHNQAQVYEYDVTRKIERRVTFQDGENASPSYHPDREEILYASSTDERKEDPLFIQLAKEKYLGTSKDKTAVIPFVWDWFPSVEPLEVYTSSRHGRNIQRLTRSPGPDREPTFHPSGKSIVFSSDRKAAQGLYLMNSEGAILRRITTSEQPHRFPQFSADERLAWIRFKNDYSSSELLVSKSTEAESTVLLLPDAIHLHPTWHPNQSWIIFSSNMEQVDNFDFYAIRPDGTCLKRLTYTLDSEFNPSFHPKGTSLIFTSNLSGLSQIFEMDFVEPQCTETPPQPKS